MTNLPKRKPQVDAEMPAEGTVIHLKPLSDAQFMAALEVLKGVMEDVAPEGVEVREKGGGWYEIRRNGDLLDKVQGEESAERRRRELSEVDEVAIRASVLEDLEKLEPLYGLVEKNIRGATELTIGGEEFNAEDALHLASLPTTWKALAVQELIAERMMPDEVGKG